MILITPEQQRLIQNLYDAATNFNCCCNLDDEREAVAIEHALIALENAGFSDGAFISPDSTQNKRSHPALTLVNGSAK